MARPRDLAIMLERKSSTLKAVKSRFRALIASLAPETIALILVLGLVLGVFPVFGCPTLLCALAALVLRLNLPALQLLNQVFSPLQLALWIPFCHVGAHIRAGPGEWSVAGAARNAVIGWFCLCVPIGLVLYFVLAFKLRRAWSRSMEAER
jgi:uncharacterized protein (DUF2062 family)